MVHSIEHAWGRFKEGVALTPLERLEAEWAARINRENHEAIQGGYSVSSRRYVSPEIPDLLERIRRGFRNVFGK